MKQDEERSKSNRIEEATKGQKEKVSRKTKKNGYQMDMTHGPMAGKILLFTLPLMLSSVMQLLFNAADIVVVGRFAGKESLAAVGSTTSLINLVTNLFIGLSIGANVVIANFLGAEKKEEIHDTLHTAITLALGSGILLLVVGVLFCRFFLLWMDTPHDVIDLGTTYLRIYFLGMPALMLYNFGSAMLRAVGDTRRPLYFLFGAGVLNVILNLILVIPCGMGVSGVGIATVVSQYLSAGLIITCLCKEQGALHLDLKSLGIRRDKMLKIMRIGLPAGLQGIVFAISNVVIQSSINSFGSVIMAGSAAAANIEGFVYMAMNALYQTALTFAGQNFGARNLKRVDRVWGLCLLFVTITGLTWGLGARLFADPLLHLYATDGLVIEAGIERMNFICVTYFLCGIMEVCVGVLRGMGRAIMPMIVSILGACGLRLVWIATYFQTHHDPKVLYAAYPISWIITLSVHVICIFIIRKKEQKKLELQTD